MIALEDNVFNRGRRQDEAKFKIWSSVGLMLSYRCPARCACCYVFSGPDAGSEETEMSVEMALEVWAGVRRLAGERGRVHITGGEPFVDYPRLRRILQGACEQKLRGLEKIETNAYWCDDEDLVRQRLSELRDLGLTRLQVSTDVYHQEYVPIERARLAVRVGREVLGEDGVSVRWRDSLDEPVLVGEMSVQERQAAFAGELARRQERLLGRAAKELVSLLPARSYDSFSDRNCWGSLLGARHVHVDGAGNVFPGTCVGIVLGQITAERGLAELWCGFDYRKHPIISVLAEGGPMGLLELAEVRGYGPPGGCAGKCHLCYDLRRFLLGRARYSEYLGPAVCYGEREF